MSAPRLLLLVVAYGNRRGVRDFCMTMRGQYDQSVVHIAVCDNSVDGEEGFDFASDVTIERPDNPGYWGGAMAALNEYSRLHPEMPDWIAITNTDLCYVTPDVLDILSDHSSSSPLVIAPRITEGEIEKNPHVLTARPPWRLFVNHLLTISPGIAAGYLVASRAKSWVGAKLRAGRKMPLAISGTRMHSPYGALIFFSSAFFSTSNVWPHVPLLAEEWAVGQMAMERSAPVIFEPRIWVRHEAHQTTGGKNSRRRAAMLSRAFEFIWATARP